MLALLTFAVALQGKDRFEPHLVDSSKFTAKIAEAEAAEAKAAAATKAMNAIPSSLLEGKAKPAPWTAADSQATEDLMAKSYTNLDTVQDEIIKAANKELADQKSLPTLAQATHHWNADKFGEAAQATSLAQTGTKDAPEDEYEHAIDFSKLDQLRHKIDGVVDDEQHDVADLKIQTQKDEAFAKQQAARRGSLAEQGTAWSAADFGAARQGVDLIAPGVMPKEARRPMDADEIAEMEHERAQRAEALHPERMHRTSQKLHAVQGKLALLERSLSAQAKSGNKEARLALEKVAALLLLSRKAGGLVDAVGKPHAHPHAQLEALRAIKRSLGAIKSHHGDPAQLEEHLRELATHLHEHEGSLLQGQPDGGYAPIEQGLASLHDRIAHQVADLKTAEQQATSAQVNTLTNSDQAYHFSWAQPSYAEVDAKGGAKANMRTHKPKR